MGQKIMGLKDYKKEDGREVNIGGETYLFYNDIAKKKELLDGFNQLAETTFGLSFERVGGYYEPHILVKDGAVCANVSVNQIPFCHNENPAFYIQLGTVMTKEAFRHKGLAGWLLQYVLEQWKDKCDAIYLFANDSVLDFYPKFGFQKRTETHYRSPMPQIMGTGMKKLQMDKPESVELAMEKYKQGNPFSALCMMENDTIFNFYCTGIWKDSVYYSSKHNVLIIAEEEQENLWCYDVFGHTDADLRGILGEINIGKHEEVFLGFTPKDVTGLVSETHSEEDTTLFIYEQGASHFEEERLMFPLLSHA